LNQIFPSFGIILILYSFLFFNFTKKFHPSIITLIPIIGVLLIIWFSKKGELITEILSTKIFVFLGLISYSLYLWHYPIFAFLRYIEVFNNNILIKLLAILLTVSVSILSYYLIERPFRNKKIIKKNILVAYILISAIILLSYHFYILKTEGIKNRFPNIISEPLTINLNEHKFNRVSGSQNNLLLIGDSHADALEFYLNNELAKLSYNFYKKNSSFYLQNFNNIIKKNSTFEEIYLVNNEKINKFLQEEKNLIVVWHQRWSIKLLEELFDNKEGHTEYQNENDRFAPNYYQPINIKTETLEERQKYIIDGIKLSAKNILKNGNVLIIVYPVPEMGFNVARSLIKKNTLFYLFKEKIEIPILSGNYDVYKDRNKIIFNTLDSIQGPDIYRVYPHKYFCNTIIVNRCVANNQQHLFYYDDDHLSFEGSKYIVNAIMKIIQELEVNKKINK
jgi:hypothetical protein